jgi:hypothetical protein
LFIFHATYIGYNESYFNYKKSNEQSHVFIFSNRTKPTFIICMINAQAFSGSTSGGISGSGTADSGSEGNNGKDQKQKANTDTQMGICLVGAGGPCNGDSGSGGIDHNAR